MHFQYLTFLFQQILLYLNKPLKTQAGIYDPDIIDHD